MTYTDPKRISNENFARYGRVARLPDDAPLAETREFSYWSDVAAFEVEGETEIGFCTVRRQNELQIDWMERHARTPEVLVPVDHPFLLPVMADEHVEVFRVEPGEAVVIESNTWHSACIPVDVGEATYLVIFRRGTPSEDVVKTDVGPVAVRR